MINEVWKSHIQNLNFSLCYRYIVLTCLHIRVCHHSAKEILAMQDSLQEIVQLVGKESLSEDQKVCLS